MDASTLRAGRPDRSRLKGARLGGIEAGGTPGGRGRYFLCLDSTMNLFT